MEFVQIILLAVVTFFFAIDQFSLTELLYRPIIACPILGAILGDLRTGLVIGGTFELIMIGNMPVGGAQPPNAVLGSVCAVVLAISAKLDAKAALGAAMIFAVFGQYVVTTTFAIMSAIMAKADKAAETANPRGIASVNYISMAILGSLFVVFALLAYFGGQSAGESLEIIKKDHSWIMAGLGTAGGMMRYVGFAVLLKIMLADDMWGIYFAGFAAAALFGGVENTKGATLLLVAFIGVAIALYDYNINVKIKNSTGSSGGMSDGI